LKRGETRPSSRFQHAPGRISAETARRSRNRKPTDWSAALRFRR
jgi:hypothetical protein